MKVEPYLFSKAGRSDCAHTIRRGPEHGLHPPGSEDKVLHAKLRIGSTTIMASDGLCGGRPKFQAFSFRFRSTVKRRPDAYFSPWPMGGDINAFGQDFILPLFGMLIDQFGVQWIMVNSEFFVDNEG